MVDRWRRCRVTTNTLLLPYMFSIFPVGLSLPVFFNINIICINPHWIIKSQCSCLVNSVQVYPDFKFQPRSLIPWHIFHRCQCGGKNPLSHRASMEWTESNLRFTFSIQIGSRVLSYDMTWLSPLLSFLIHIAFHLSLYYILPTNILVFISHLQL